MSQRDHRDSRPAGALSRTWWLALPSLAAALFYGIIALLSDAAAALNRGTIV